MCVSPAEYLEAAIVGAELLSQDSVVGVEGFLLQTAVHQHVDNLPLLLVLQAHPSHTAKEKLLHHLPSQLGCFDATRRISSSLPLCFQLNVETHCTGE